jgi:hypothetical protein
MHFVAFSCRRALGEFVTMADVSDSKKFLRWVVLVCFLNLSDSLTIISLSSHVQSRTPKKFPYAEALLVQLRLRS